MTTATKRETVIQAVSALPEGQQKAALTRILSHVHMLAINVRLGNDERNTADSTRSLLQCVMRHKSARNG